MYKSNLIFVIVAREGKVARLAYDPKNVNKTKRLLTGNTDMQPNTAVLQTVAFTLGQLSEKNTGGRVSFVVHDDVAIRYFELVNAVRNGNDPVETLQKGWMNDEMKAAIEEFCTAVEMLEGSSVELNFVKLSNVYNWKLSIKQEGIELKEGMEIDFADGIGLGGAVEAEAHLNGKYAIAKHNNEFVIPRRANSMSMINLRKAVEHAWSQCPEEEADFSEGVAIDEVG